MTTPTLTPPPIAAPGPAAEPPARGLARIAHYIFLHARRRPAAIAVRRGPAAITYAALAGDLAAIIRTLEALEIPPGAIAAIAHEDLYIQLLLVYGCEALGITTGSYRPREGRECHALLAMAGIVFTSHPNPAVTGRLVELTPAWLAAARANPPATRLRLTPAHPDDIMVITRSSGTTGAPKRMALSYAAVRHRMAGQRRGAFAAPLTRETRYLTFMHFAVANIFRAVTNVICLGGTFMFDLPPEPGAPAPDAAKYLAARNPTHTTLPPAQLRALLANLAARSTPLLPGLAISTQGAKLPRDLRQAALQKLAGRIDDGYGTNETGAIGRVDEAGILHVIPGCEAEIVDEAGETLKPGEAGALRLRSPSMVTGYIENPAATAEMFRPSPADPTGRPWFHPGDLGILITQGKVQLTGRRIDVLNLGGAKIAAADLEARILAAALVADVALIQAPFTVQAEGPAPLVVCAVPAPHTRPAGLHALIAPLLDYPFNIRLVARIPRTPEGKIQRTTLQAAIFSTAARAPAGSSANVPAAAASPTNIPAMTSEI